MPAESAWLGTEIAKLGPFEPIYTGRGGIPGVTWTQKPDPKAPYTLYDLADRLRTRGWQVPAYAMPANCDSSKSWKPGSNGCPV